MIISSHYKYSYFQIFWKTQTLFKKLEYRFLVETTKFENATFPYKTVLLEANVETYRGGGVLNGPPIRKNGVFPVTTLFFQKFCFSLRTSY